MEDLIQIETMILGLLLIVSLVAIVVRRFNMPYTVALVLAGFLLSLRSGIELEITSEIILTLLLPPLVFEAAFHLKFDALRDNFTTIALLAVPGVILNMLVVGGVVGWGAGLSWPIALVFGSLIAATDPVAVVVIFRKLGVPKRLEVLLEGESLLNDGTAIVIFNLAIVSALTGHFDLVEGVFEFIRVAGGGIAVGVLLGWLTSRLASRVDEYLIVTTLTTIVAFGSYTLAEYLEFSGVLAVVMAGLVSGNVGPRSMSPTTRIILTNFWDYVTFLANSAVFLLIGLEIDLPQLFAHWQSILWAIAGVLLSRAIVIYGLSRLGRSLPADWRHVLFWGGLRGAIALALAISLPHTLGPERNVVVVMTFGVVLFTILGQGLSLDWLVHRLGLISRSEERIEFERRNARALGARASYEHLRSMHEDGLISTHTWTRMRPLLEERMEALTDAVQEALRHAPDLEAAEVATARREVLSAKRSKFTALRRDGLLSAETYDQLVSEIDMALDAGVDNWAMRLIDREAQDNIKHLIFIIVQQRDRETVISTLATQGIFATVIQAHGGFLGQPNQLLLVGVPEGCLDDAISKLKSICRGRIEYLQSPPDAFPMVVTPVPVRVGGATLFTFDVERFIWM